MNQRWGLSTFGLGVFLAGICFGGDGWIQNPTDSARISVRAEGIRKLEGEAYALFRGEGKKELRVGGAEYVCSEGALRSTCSTPFGDAALTTLRYRKAGSPYSFTLRVKELKRVRAFTVQGILHNESEKDIHFNSFELFSSGKNGFIVEHPEENWLVTPLLQDLPPQPLSTMNRTLREAAWIRNPKGNGFLVGPVGPGEAYTLVDVRKDGLRATVQMDGVLVRAGESRRTEEMIFCFEPGKAATDLWTRWVAITHGARLDKGRRYGWCSWYDRTTRIDERHMLDITKTIAGNPDVFGRGVIQLDDGYQKMDGDWRGNEKFPKGLAALAKEIREIGCVPGVWFAPLRISPKHPFCKAHPDALQRRANGKLAFDGPGANRPDGSNWIVPDHPASKPFLAKIIQDARDRGFEYLKIDFNGIGSRFADPTKTRLQIFRELYAMYRKTAGDGMYILSCLGQPNRGVIGYADAVRIGPDTHPANLGNCLKSALPFQIYQNVWWQNDPDVSYLTMYLKNRWIRWPHLTRGMWRTWHATVALAGGSSLVSEPLEDAECREVWRNYEIMRPSSAEPARLLTLGKSPLHSVFGFVAQRNFGDFAVYNLYNSEKEKRAITIDLTEAGLPKGIRCAVYDFWEDRFLGYATDQYTTSELEGLSSTLLRFTPIVGELPILVGSNLHLSIGATEIESITTTAGSVSVSLTDAGAREGTLTIYSERTLANPRSNGCHVDQVEKVGDNLWKISISGRKWNVKSSFTLDTQKKD